MSKVIGGKAVTEYNILEKKIKTHEQNQTLKQHETKTKTKKNILPSNPTSGPSSQKQSMTQTRTTDSDSDITDDENQDTRDMHRVQPIFP